MEKNLMTKTNSRAALASRSTEPGGVTDEQIELVFYTHDISLPPAESGYRTKFLDAVHECIAAASQPPGK